MGGGYRYVAEIWTPAAITVASFAARLIPLRDLCDALAWSERDQEAAEQLWVDLPTLRVRLATLLPSEREYLAARTEHHSAL